jgi:ATP-binding cassette subfamily A (ABC1) protein 3
VKERETKSKHQQVVSGIDLNAYWFSTFLWDMVTFAPTPVLCMIFFAAFGVTSFIKGGAWLPVFIMLCLYGTANSSMTYMTSFLFRRHAG